MKVVRLANYVAPASGGLRTALRELGAGYLAAGHEPVLVLLARLLATADVVIAPGPVETFGLSALEALASGTPVVVSSRSALPEVVGSAGLAATDNEAAVADAVEELLQRDMIDRRCRARKRAERFDWPSAVNGFLTAHGLATSVSKPPETGTRPVPPPIMQPVGHS